MIIWIASYPKSGNTWVRSIISSLLYTQDGFFDFKLLKKIDQFPQKKHFVDFVNDFGNLNQIASNWISAQDRINLDGNIKLYKTHQGKYTLGNSDFTNNENTKAVIYVVRDPRNVISSISSHYVLTMEQSLEFMLSPKFTGNIKSFEEEKDGILTLLGKWNDHYRSWTRIKKNFLLIRYEDLILDPNLELKKIISFLKKYINFHTNDNKNNNIIKTTSFENLRKMENEDLFKEAVLDKKTNSKVKFFNLGPKNKWEGKINKEITNSLEKNFFKEMSELKYL